MNMPIDKLQVARQFSRAAKSYSQASLLQQDMSDQLLRLCATYIPPGKLCIADLGCGTGYSLNQLIKTYPNAIYTGVDISEAMIEEAYRQVPKAVYVCTDMETYSPKNKQDLIFANASVQWCDFDRVAASVYSALKPEGLFAFTSFGPKTHKEISSAWQEVDPSVEDKHTIDFVSVDSHIQKLHKTGFEILEQHHQIAVQEFNDTDSLLKSIKETGATNATNNRDRGLLSRTRYNQFISALSAKASSKLSYEIMSFVVRKQTA